MKYPSTRGLLCAASIAFAVLSGQTANAVDSAQQIAPADGWASQAGGTLGGSAASASNIYTASNRTQLLNALSNGGSAPKIIKIVGTIDMSEGVAFSSHADQATRAAITLPANTTLIGNAANAAIVNGYINISGISQVIIRNLKLVAPCDVAPSWDADAGNWTSSFQAVQVSSSHHVWIDHNTFTDTPVTNDTLAIDNGKVKECHDGALDIKNASDYVTVSYNLFNLHSKNNLIGASDTATGDAGHLTVSFSNNVFSNITMRTPRVRYGQVHLFNNYYTGSKSHPVYPHAYSVGAGVAAKILSNNNVFEIVGATSCADVITNPSASAAAGTFKDAGSTLNGLALSGCALSNNVSWVAPYAFSVRPIALVKANALAQSGSGKLTTAITGTGSTSSSSSSVSSSVSSSSSSSGTSGDAIYDIDGYAAQELTTGGGVIPETDPAYRKVSNSYEFLIALKNAKEAPGSVKVIEITNNLNLGFNELVDANGNLIAGNAFGFAYLGSSCNTATKIISGNCYIGPQKAAPLQHPIMKQSGVSKILIQSTDNLTIFSKNGAKIKHASWNIKQSHNIIIRNLEFDEMWEWDDGPMWDPVRFPSKGIFKHNPAFNDPNYATTGIDLNLDGWKYYDGASCGLTAAQAGATNPADLAMQLQTCPSNGNYDRNDWDYIVFGDSGGNLENTTRIWVDHCTFHKAYDGILDIKNATHGVTVSWSKVLDDNSSAFFLAQFDDLEAKYQAYLGGAPQLNPYYDRLRGFFSRAEIQLFAGTIKKLHLVGVTTLSESALFTETLHHNYYRGISDRFPRLRTGDAQVSNILVDATLNRKLKELLDARKAANPILANLINKVTRIYAGPQNAFSSADASVMHFDVISNGTISTEKGRIEVRNSAYLGVQTPLRNNQTDPRNLIACPSGTENCAPNIYTGALRAYNTLWMLPASDTAYMPEAFQQGTSSDYNNLGLGTWAYWKGNCFNSDTDVGKLPTQTTCPMLDPLGALVIKWPTQADDPSLNNPPPTIKTLHQPEELLTLLPTSTGAGVLNWSAQQWLSTTNP